MTDNFFSNWKADSRKRLARWKEGNLARAQETAR